MPTQLAMPMILAKNARNRWQTLRYSMMRCNLCPCNATGNGSDLLRDCLSRMAANANDAPPMERL